LPRSRDLVSQRFTTPSAIMLLKLGLTELEVD
jgi:hypothetical protein